MEARTIRQNVQDILGDCKYAFVLSNSLMCRIQCKPDTKKKDLYLSALNK